MVIGTMWLEFWKELTSAPDDGAPDVNHQTRELLLHDAERVDVPETFTGRDRAQLGRVLATDPRLAAAAAAAERDGKVVQVLAGGPELVQRYDHPADAEDRFGKAVLTAAMDARRVGCESPIGGRSWSAAAPAYLDPSDRAGAPETWFDTGLASRHPRDPRHRGPDRATAGTRHRAGRWIRATRLPRSIWTADAPRGARTGRGVGCAHRRRAGLRGPDPARAASRVARALPLRCRPRATRRGGWPGHCDAADGEAARRGRSQRARRRSGRAGPQKPATRWRCSSTPSGWTRRATATEPTRSSALPPVTAIPPPSWALAARLDEAGKTEDAERVLVQGAEAGDTVVMERLAEHLDKADRRDDATGWLRRAAEAGDTIAMQQLAARLDEDGEPDDAERWLVRAAEADDHFAHFVRMRLYLRLDEAGRPDEADAWFRRDIEAGETSSLVILASRARAGGERRGGGGAEATCSRGGRIPRPAARDRGAQASCAVEQHTCDL